MVVLIWLASIIGLVAIPEATVTFFDVGQGDSAFIEWEDGTQMLIDGGASTDVLSELGRTMLPWDRYIDYVVLTHPHADHSRGLVSVIDRYDVGAIIKSDKAYNEGWYSEFERVALEKGIRVLKPWEMEVSGIDLLYPLNKHDYVDHPNINEASIVMLVDGTHPVLFMGDAGIVVEQRLINFHRFSDVSVMKIGHHGSRTSTSQAWLRSVSPEVAVISVGEDNRHGHPHAEVENRLGEYVKSIFRTDTSGAVRIRMFKDRLDISTEN